MQASDSISLSLNRKWLRIISLIEGTSLLILLGIAVPLKHLFNHPQLVSIAGPVHGLAVVIYFWLTLNVAGHEQWSTLKILRMLGAALVPFGGYIAANNLKPHEGLK